MIEIKNVSKHFGGVKALNSCSLEIKDGMTTAIIGPNGSGKSTLFHAISQLSKASSGEIVIGGRSTRNMSPSQVAKSGISRTFQEVRLFHNLTVLEHMRLAIGTFESIIDCFSLSPFKLSKMKKILAEVGFEKSLKTRVTDLSYGQRKLLDLAIALGKPHKYLLLDEPVAGVNPKLRDQISKLLRRLQKNGETIVLIEHDMTFVMNIADYVYVLDRGKVIAQGTPKQVSNNKRVLDAYLGD